MREFENYFVSRRSRLLLLCCIAISCNILFSDRIRLVFFFSCRRRHTRWTGDWSSDVCSSDLRQPHPSGRRTRSARSGRDQRVRDRPSHHRSEERRVGKECRSRWSPYYQKKTQEEHIRNCWQHSGRSDQPCFVSAYRCQSLHLDLATRFHRICAETMW